ncbi:MAG: hypothetical protein ACR2RB_08650, partial [Gammaproteobacteria bacterium]
YGLLTALCVAFYLVMQSFGKKHKQDMSPTNAVAGVAGTVVCLLAILFGAESQGFLHVPPRDWGIALLFGGVQLFLQYAAVTRAIDTPKKPGLSPSLVSIIMLSDLLINPVLVLIAGMLGIAGMDEPIDGARIGGGVTVTLSVAFSLAINWREQRRRQDDPRACQTDSALEHRLDTLIQLLNDMLDPDREADDCR